jgi:hypothetical protein
MEGKICDPALAGFVFVSFGFCLGEFLLDTSGDFRLISIAVLADHPSNVGAFGFSDFFWRS